jgi:hypothetical protein
VTEWSGVFLGLIALSTTVMAAIQVGAIVQAARIAGRLERLAQQVERDVRPMIDRLTAMTGDAARATSLAVTQVERVDHLVADLSTRLDQTMAQVQQAIAVPAREGQAVIAALKAVLAALRRGRSGPVQAGGTVDEDDALFIG